ncbi:MAG: hypothetical protein ACTSW1_18765 [Candidatus Hodarchaeales archaeon]
MVELKRDSDLAKFLLNYLVAEVLFFVGTGILVTTKAIFAINDIDKLLEGSFLGDATNGLWGQAFSQEQINWIISNISGTWLINVFLALFSSLLLVAGFLAVVILVTVSTLFDPSIKIFEGPGAPKNAIPAEAMPLGFLFLFCWGLIPTLFMVRSTWIGYLSRIKNIFVPGRK